MFSMCDWKRNWKRNCNASHVANAKLFNTEYLEWPIQQFKLLLTQIVSQISD